MEKLIVKSVAGFVFLMLVVALSLFISAGSPGFWQAWVYLSVFAACTLIITAYLLKYDQQLLAGRVKAGPIAETQKRQKVIQTLASLIFICQFIVAGLDFRFHWSDVPPVLSLIADAFVILGLWVVFLVFQENSYARATIEVSPRQRVIDSGPYRVIRHPMYAGASLFLVFSPLALGSWAALPLPVFLILVIIARLFEEERFLKADLQGYSEYCQKVRRRLIPFIW